MSDDQEKDLPVYGHLRQANHRVRHDGWTGERQRTFLMRSPGIARCAMRASRWDCPTCPPIACAGLIPPLARRGTRH